MSSPAGSSRGGIRGITSNPSIFQKAMSTGTDYDEQFRRCWPPAPASKDSYWQLVIDDIHHALPRSCGPVYDSSDGVDGYVSVEVDPRSPATRWAPRPRPATCGTSSPSPTCT